MVNTNHTKEENDMDKKLEKRLEPLFAIGNLANTIYNDSEIIEGRTRVILENLEIVAKARIEENEKKLDAMLAYMNPAVVKTVKEVLEIKGATQEQAIEAIKEKYGSCVKIFQQYYPMDDLTLYFITPPDKNYQNYVAQRGPAFFIMND